MKARLTRRLVPSIDHVVPHYFQIVVHQVLTDEEGVFRKSLKLLLSLANIEYVPSTNYTLQCYQRICTLDFVPSSHVVLVIGAAAQPGQNKTQVSQSTLALSSHFTPRSQYIEGRPSRSAAMVWPSNIQ